MLRRSVSFLIKIKIFGSKLKESRKPRKFIKFSQHDHLHNICIPTKKESILTTALNFTTTDNIPKLNLIIIWMKIYSTNKKFNCSVKLELISQLSVETYSLSCNVLIKYLFNKLIIRFLVNPFIKYLREKWFLDLIFIALIIIANSLNS